MKCAKVLAAVGLLAMLAVSVAEVRIPGKWVGGSFCRLCTYSYN